MSKGPSICNGINASGNSQSGNSDSGQGPARIIITGGPLNDGWHWWYLV